MESIWSKTCDIPPREPLRRDEKTKVAIIGAGMAGILTAYLLQKQGMEALVLEAGRIGGGQTRNTTAKVTSQHGYCYHTLMAEAGKEKAKQYADAGEAAIAAYERIITEEGINCDWERKPAFLYSTAESEPLRQEAEAAADLGLPASFTTRTELPFGVEGAVRFENQAQFHPLKFLSVISKNLTVYEQTKVTGVEEHILHTAKHTVQAEHIVFASHYPFINMPGYYFMRMHQERSYLLALENAKQIGGIYISMDQEGYTLRNYGDQLLFGGANHRTGENSRGGRYERLRAAAKEFYPNAKEIAHWSAQDCMTLDNRPYIGQYSLRRPTWYVATGFCKWGMTASMAAAGILADSIGQRENPYAPAFFAQRVSPSTLPAMIKDGAQAVKGLARENLRIPQETLDEIKPGQGGVVSAEGEKVGVYKDDAGEVFLVSTRCPHLGCQLEWNPDEKSWDCPCHGSRFSYTGQLLDGPAQEEITLV